MVFEKIQTAGIAQLLYLIGDDGSQTAAVIDPRPDVEIDLKLARNCDCLSRAWRFAAYKRVQSECFCRVGTATG